MNLKIFSAIVAALAIGASSAVPAADSDAKPQRGMGGMPGMEAMHGQGQPGMMGAMGGCPMMGGAMHGGMGMMPQLPPGNEKLQLQMWGEMMQKMGEIASKYAAQVK